MVLIIATTILFISLIILMLSCDYDLPKWKIYLPIFCVPLIITGIVVNFKNDTYKVKYSKSLLENLKDNTFISGHISMSLGSGGGKIKQDFEYTMYIKTPKGARLIRLPLDKCRIVYSKKPELITFMKEFIPPTNWERVFYINYPDKLIVYELRVPKNAINGVFSLDAQ